LYDTREGGVKSERGDREAAGMGSKWQGSRIVGGK